MGRASKLNDLAVVISFDKDGLTWRQLLKPQHISYIDHEKGNKVVRITFVFSRQTLSRHLKSLLAEGIIERIRQPAQPKQNGRPTSRYRIKETSICVASIRGLRLSADNKLVIGVDVRNSKSKVQSHFREFKGELLHKPSRLDPYTKENWKTKGGCLPKGERDAIVRCLGEINRSSCGRLS